MNHETLIEEINTIRKSNGLTYQTVADACGMKKENVWRALNSNSPQIGTLFIIAEACGVKTIEAK